MPAGSSVLAIGFAALSVIVARLRGVLALTGLALSLREAGVGATDAVNGQLVAEPVVATLVGSIALLVSVPLTTGLAAHLVARVPASALAGARDAHAH